MTIEGGAFFSLDAEKHFPNFATIVWTDDFDQASGLSRPGFFRVNIGVSRGTFDRLVGSVADPDYTAPDTLLPHPVYARQHWMSILNPSDATWRHVVLPLIAEAHDRLAAQRARHHLGKGQREDFLAARVGSPGDASDLHEGGVSSLSQPRHRSDGPGSR